jgi:hypothetical protein
MNYPKRDSSKSQVPADPVAVDSQAPAPKQSPASVPVPAKPGGNLGGRVVVKETAPVGGAPGTLGGRVVKGPDPKPL